MELEFLKDPAYRLAASQLAEVATLPFHRRKWRGAAGELAGSGVGSSIDFHDQRLYSPGDDPRHINWQAYARSGDYQMKLYREEVRPELVLLLDASASMLAYPAKARRFAELTHFCLSSAQQVGAHIRCFLVADKEMRRLDQEKLANGDWTQDFEEVARDSQSAPQLASLPLRPNSMRILISDLLYPCEPESLLRPLAHQAAQVLILAPHAREESSPDWQGNCLLLDPESARESAVYVADSARQAYQNNYRSHFTHWQRACARHQAEFHHLSAELALEELAASFPR